MNRPSVLDPANEAARASNDHRRTCPRCGNGCKFRPDGSISGHSSADVDPTIPRECAEGDRLREICKGTWDEVWAHSRRVQELPGMGYWGEGDRKAEILSHVASMTITELCSVIAYMKAADYGIGWRGYAGCRLCGETLGTRCMVTPDFKWRFPEKWEHYIEKHGIRPFPEQFIQDAIAWAGPLG